MFDDLVTSMTTSKTFLLISMYYYSAVIAYGKLTQLMPTWYYILVDAHP